MVIYLYKKIQPIRACWISKRF